jgi:cell division septation protein DedD
VSRPRSARRLLLQVVILAALLIGLSRLAGRRGTPAGGDATRTEQARSAPTVVDELTSAPPDLTFYRTLGDGRSPAAGRTSNNNDAPVRAPEPAKAGEGAFVVQALATRDAAAARRLRERVAAAGFPASVSEDHATGRPVYRVRVGRYRARAEAEAAVRVLHQRYHLRPWILQEGE